jgi:hypothetical protein
VAEVLLLKRCQGKGGQLHKFKSIIICSLIAAAASLTACGKDQRGALISGQIFGSIGLGSNSPGVPDPIPTAPNAKVFMKSPVFGAQKPVGYNVLNSDAQGNITPSPATAQNFDSYLVDVILGGTVGGLLQNADLSVKTDYLDGTGFHVSTLQRAQMDSTGKWNYSSVNDPNHRLGQVMAYYWIQSEKNTANAAIPGGWHATGKNISIYSYCYDANGTFGKTNLGLNAFWAGLNSNFTCMGYVGPFEFDFDASVYAHEMGHADIDYATNGQITAGNKTSIACSFDANNSCCPNSDGCSDAMNEGQADVHAFITFNSGALGEFFMNSLSGLDGRNGDLNANLTSTAMFNGTATDPITNQPYGKYGAEIHSMGGVWGAAWWTLRKNLGAGVADKIFFAHLELLTGGDTFKTALSAIVTADQTLVTNGTFAANHQTQILAAFQQHGITP